MKKIIKLTSLFLVLVILTSCDGGNSSEEAFDKKFRYADNIDLVFLNGTGETITAIEIRSKEDKNICSMSDISVEDQKAIGIDLPAQMENKTKFQVIIKYGKRKAKTKKIELSRKVNKIPPKYLMTIKGKDSTIPLAGGAIAGAATTAGIAATGTAIISGASWATALFNLTGAGAGALTGTLAWIGGSMASGVATVAVIPLAVGGGVFGLLYFLGADSLILTEIQIE